MVQGEVLYTDLLTGDQRSNLPEDLVERGRVGARRWPRPRPARHDRRARSASTACSAPTASRSAGGQGTTQSRELDRRRLGQPVPPRPRARRRRATTRSCSTSAAAEEGDLRLGDTVDGRHPGRTAASTRSSASSPSAPPRAPAAPSPSGFTTARGAAAGRPRRRDHRDLREGRIGRLPGGAGRDHRPDRSPAPAEVDHRRGGRRPALRARARPTSGSSPSPSRSSAAIALLVGIFVISNTFSILVAQRTKELALLRALGASRVQVLGSVLLEATVVGAVAAVLGLFGGLLLTKGVTAGLGGIGRLAAERRRWCVAPDTIVIVAAHRHRRHRDSPRCSRRCGRRGCRRSPPSATSRSTGRTCRGPAIVVGVLALAGRVVQPVRRLARQRRHQRGAAGRHRRRARDRRLPRGRAGARRADRPGPRRARSPASAASPASSPRRTPPAAPSAPRPPRRRWSSAWPSWCSSRCSPRRPPARCSSEVERGFAADFVVNSKPAGLMISRRDPDATSPASSRRCAGVDLVSRPRLRARRAPVPRREDRDPLRHRHRAHEDRGRLPPEDGRRARSPTSTTRA